VSDDDGLDFERNGKGMYRWRWVSPGGAEFIGPTWYRTKTKAREAFDEWLERRNS